MKWPFNKTTQPIDKTTELIWIDGYGEGFQKGLDIARPLYDSVNDKLIQQIRQRTIDEVFQQNPQLRQHGIIKERRQQMEKKLEEARTPEDKARYSHYIEALTWALNGNH